MVVWPVVAEPCALQCALTKPAAYGPALDGTMAVHVFSSETYFQYRSGRDYGAHCQRRSDCLRPVVPLGITGFPE
jgi:hypothetical protein